MSRLRDFRHIRDLPGFADPGLGMREWDSEKSKRIEALRHQRLRLTWEHSKVGVTDELVPYVNGRQNAGWILGFEREGDRFTLTSSDEDAILLAEWSYDIPWKQCVFPFHFVFENVAYVGWRRVDSRGNLRWAPPPKDMMESDAAWLMDGLTEPESEGIRWALSTRSRSSPDFEETVLLIEAQSMRVVERQREAWRRNVGESSLPVYDAYHARRRTLSLNKPDNLEAFCREFGLPGRSGR